jgi:endonuclease/exonuclease/phosphatase family metal-dependent hydrolase
MVRLICYNIEYCEGMSGHWYEYLKLWRTLFPPKRLDYEMAHALKSYDPDIVALVEVDTGSFRSKKDEAVFFKEQLNLDSVAERVKYAGIWLSLFHHVPILSKQANAIISRYKFEDIKYHVLHEGTKRVIIEATLFCPQKLTLLLAHLSLGNKTRQKQIKELKEIINQIDHEVILMGDFNTFNGSSEINELLNETKLEDKYLTDTKILTQPAYKPKRCLDYVLYSKGIKVQQYRVLKIHFSDHLPLCVDFNFKERYK